LARSLCDSGSIFDTIRPLSVGVEERGGGCSINSASDLGAHSKEANAPPGVTKERAVPFPSAIQQSFTGEIEATSWGHFVFGGLANEVREKGAQHPRGPTRRLKADRSVHAN
jgi:hypothetical protein